MTCLAVCSCSDLQNALTSRHQPPGALVRLKRRSSLRMFGREALVLLAQAVDLVREFQLEAPIALKTCAVLHLWALDGIQIGEEIKASDRACGVRGRSL